MSNRARILIVDDERSIRELLEIFLRKEGYDVQTAQSVPAGLELIKSTEFDLIVSDIRMPDMSGIDLLRHVRSNNFNGQFILLTAVRQRGRGNSGAEDGCLRLHPQDRELS